MMDTRVEPACDWSLSLLLRLPLLHGSAGIAPCGKAAAHMRDRVQSHVLRGFGGQRRAHTPGAVEDEFLVLLEDRLGIGTRRIDPELQHAAGAGECPGDFAVTLDLSGVADVDDDDVVAFRRLDRIRRADGLDLSIGFVDQRLDAAVNGLGHGLSFFLFWRVIPRRVEDANYIRPLRALSGITKLVTAPIP